MACDDHGVPCPAFEDYYWAFSVAATLRSASVQISLSLCSSRPNPSRFIIALYAYVNLL